MARNNKQNKIVTLFREELKGPFIYKSKKDFEFVSALMSCLKKYSLMKLLIQMQISPFGGSRRFFVSPILKSRKVMILGILMLSMGNAS